MASSHVRPAAACVLGVVMPHGRGACPDARAIMMRPTAAAALLVVLGLVGVVSSAPTTEAPPRLVFEPPILLGGDKSFGIQATLTFSPTEFAAYLGAGKVALSVDGGASFKSSTTFPPGFTVPEWPVVANRSAGGWAAHDFGNISTLHHQKTDRPTWFNFSVPTVNTFEYAEGRLSWSQTAIPVSFGGLPFGAGGELYVRGLRLQGGGQVTLSDGSLLHSASAWFPEW